MGNYYYDSYNNLKWLEIASNSVDSTIMYLKLSYENFLDTDKLLSIEKCYLSQETYRLNKIDNTFDKDIRKLTGFIINRLYWKSNSIRLRTFETYGKLFFMEEPNHIYILTFDIDKKNNFYYPKYFSRLYYYSKDAVMFNQSMRARELSVLDSADIINQITESMENSEDWFKFLVKGTHYTLL